MTDAQVVWRDAGPFKRITVYKREVPHDFPMPHVDFLEDTVSYKVPADRIGDVIAFDGSSTINRTAGELSARCDLEAHKHTDALDQIESMSSQVQNDPQLRQQLSDTREHVSAHHKEARALQAMR